MCRAYTGVIHCVFDQIPKLLYHPKQNLGGDIGSQTDKHLPPSTFQKSRHLGFGVFIDIWSMDHPWLFVAFLLS